ncbi:hypothetical protein JSY14_01855 [Brachybacterium sp. EF45031]|uniref:hypothetical protein n=1 Tax=Brachybacterium sillae TaxID=2810536 RepID=UPI00217D410A|nr:hypothetical protein [Brachybacterium sillae]MCS6710825.1 hypothetical protein [Brachybacterium sillae]
MLENIVILAEAGSHEAGGINPYLVGLAMLVVLLCLLGITYLFSGLNQTRRGSGSTAPTARSEHERIPGVADQGPRH